MVGYTTIGTNDFAKAVAFYDALLAPLGAKQLLSDDRSVVFGKDASGGMLMVCKPYDEGPASVGNGVMVALQGGTPDGVKELYARAVKLGATDDGEPGPRGDGGFYAGYFRDLDGNKLCAFCFA